MNKMWETMSNCNGEIRVQAGRYGGGWLAAGCADIEWEFDEQWEDLVCGDIDYFNSRDFFNGNEHTVLIEGASSAEQAFQMCAEALDQSLSESDQ